MDNRSHQASLRGQLFTSLVAKRGAKLLPGYYGGDFNGDQLAIVEHGDVLILFLGLKMIEPDGGVQLDNASLGAHTQLSASWFKILVASLGLNGETAVLGEKIVAAINSKKLVAIVVSMNAETQEVRMFKVDV
ncbi:hypothetical protein PMM47T1_20728 [Pseudomonas sp. M47T1]|uniref:hypothetical protein n=1 Tax=Pseudomonas sp. M47T1 TaxID=1179778 RepID=UPI00026072FA|nr:hypothetical protein [Pseudomonas sp. M47T1]EIK94557.1 hypothetical protein PMM47T1_20728 [Pseudomonas sp. M47T1]